MKTWLSSLLLGVLLGAAGCSPAATPAPANTPTLTPVTVVMSYVPNVQYAPFFVAEKKGYFAREGIKLNYNWGYEYDGVKLVGADQADFAVVGGDQVLQARAQGIPLVYVTNWYNAYPIVIFSLAEKNIKTPQDLIGKKVGLPFFGATYTGWRAMLYTQKLDESKINAQDIGFTQVQAVTLGAVDAAAGYANNEPIQLELAGRQVNVIRVWDYARLVGNGIVASEKTVKERPALVQGFVRALLQGVKDTMDKPAEALDVSAGFYPEFGDKNADSSSRVLAASIELWKSPRLGYSDPAAWQAMAQFMQDTGLVKSPGDLSRAFTNQFVP